MPVQGGGRETGASVRTGPGRQDALALLARDHRELLALFQQYAAADAAGKAALAERICLLLEVHTRIEEEIFYPAARRRIEDKDLVQEALAEHEAGKALMAQVKAAQADGAERDARVQALHAQLEPHIREEENELFPEVRAAEIDLMGLGARLFERRRQVLQELGGEAGEAAAAEPRSFDNQEGV